MVGEAALVLAGEGPEGDALAQAVGREPTPEFAAMVAEETLRRLGMLEDETLRNVAVWRMEGYSTEEIAARLGCTTRTVERKADLIRQIWDREPSG